MDIVKENEQIGLLKIQNVDYGIWYLGGSTFLCSFKKDRSQNNTLIVDEMSRLSKDKLVELIDKKVALITDPYRYNEILSNIDPVTGDSPTHWKNGQAKTMVEIEVNRAKTEPTNNNDDVAPVRIVPGKGNFAPEMTVNHDDDNTDAETVNDEIDYDPDDDTTDRIDFQPTNNKVTNARSIVFGFFMIAFCIVCFFVSHALTSGLAGKMNLPFLNNNGQSSIFSSLGNNNNNNANTADSEETVVRTDYDPELSIVSNPYADDSHRNNIAGLFDAIRGSYKDKNVEMFKQLVALDAISKQIGNSYAAYDVSVHSLTEAEKQNEASYYATVFAERELSHVANNDMYASIFGGRIRSIRVDAKDDTRFYVSMESLGGDHQRACFLVQRSGNSYALTGIIGVDGYVQMIRKA